MAQNQRDDGTSTDARPHSFFHHAMRRQSARCECGLHVRHQTSVFHARCSERGWSTRARRRVRALGFERRMTALEMCGGQTEERPAEVLQMESLCASRGGKKQKNALLME